MGHQQGDFFCKNELQKTEFYNPYELKSNFSLTAVHRGKALKKTGLILMGVGIVSLFTGIAIMVSHDSYGYSYQNTNGYVEESGTPMVGLGFVLALTGGLSTGAGIPLFIIGNKKQKR